MVDLLAQGAAWLDEKRHAYLTRTVTFRRGDEGVDVQATIGKTVFRLDDAPGSGGTSIMYISRDYLIRAADLILPSDVKPTLPRRGDQIDEIDGDGKVRVHEVMGPGNGEPEWRYSDLQRRVLRIHTKEVSVSE